MDFALLFLYFFLRSSNVVLGDPKGKSKKTMKTSSFLFSAGPINGIHSFPSKKKIENFQCWSKPIQLKKIEDSQKVVMNNKSLW